MTSTRNKPESCLMSPLKPSENTNQEVSSEVSDCLLDIEDIIEETWNSFVENEAQNLPPVLLQEEGEFATLEFQATVKKKTWKPRLDSCSQNTLLTNLSEILDQGSTLKEKDCKPFWTPYCTENSKKLWLPTEIDCVDLATSLSNKYADERKQESWFSIKERQVLMKDLQKIYLASSLSLAPECMAHEVIKPAPRKNPKTKKILPEVKTLKFRLFPTTSQAKELQTCLDQARWYYNALIHLQDSFDTKLKSSFQSLRNKLRKYQYHEEKNPDVPGEILKDFIFSEEREAFPCPVWWQTSNGESKVPNRIPRGAVRKYTQNYNSMVSNFFAGNCKSEPSMGFLSRKKDKQWCLFEDTSCPAWFWSSKLKSRYWYRKRGRAGKKHRQNIALKDAREVARSLELIYDRYTDKYFIHLVVPYDWFPEEDHREVPTSWATGEVVAIDPGVRKFAAGFDAEGNAFQIGDKAQAKLWELMIQKDAIKNKKAKGLIQRRIQNLVSDLHWKSIKYLTDRYTHILYPDFRIQGMVKGRKLHAKTKRMLYAFSYHSFKEKLAWKCHRKNNKIYFVNEAYTSKTCTGCGIIRNVGSKEYVSCDTCKTEVDRDYAGARNIFLKYVNF